MKTALVCGAGGFIGNHLVNRLKKDGYWVRGVDLKYPEFSQTQADEFITGDLTGQNFVDRIVRTGDYHSSVPVQYQEQFDEIYQLAADMGGAGYIFTGDHDANVMRNSATINLGSERQYSVLEVIKLTEKISGKTIPYEIVERREGDPDKIYASSDYAKDILNWSAEESNLKNIIETTWQIYK